MKRKTILITGASRGIGRSTALLFAENNYHVYLNCSQSIEKLYEVKEQIDEMDTGSCEVLRADVGNPAQVREMFRQIRRSQTENSGADCGVNQIPGRGLDVLVNNAGIAHAGLLMDMTDAEWNRIIQTNLSSVFYCCRSALPDMVSRKQGKIINVSSMWGTSGASCEAAYSASKAGIHGLTKALAKELAPSNIQVNAVAFGVVDTSMNQQLNEEERNALKWEIPAGRFAAPEEAAKMIFQIAKAPDYMTGQIIGFDGGYL